MKHRILALFILTAILVSASACGSHKEQENLLLEHANDVQHETFATDPTTLPKPTTTRPPATTAAVTETAPPPVTAPPAVQPAGEKSELYQMMLEHFQAQKTEILFDNPIPREVISKTLEEVVMDHPELFWIESWSTTCTSSWTKVELELDIDQAALAEKIRQLNNAVQVIIDQVPAGADAYTKALFVHDYMTAFTKYDEGAAVNNRAIRSYTAYDCLVGHVAVCSGYSRAYQLIMQRLGVECGYCYGMSTEGVSHAWNYVRIDGLYYWVDVTYDDPIPGEGGGSSELQHCYFMMTDEMLRRTRSVDAENAFVPVCNSMAHNYYVMNRTYLDTYSREAVENIVARFLPMNRAEIMFGSEEAYRAAITDLLDNGGIWSLGTFATTMRDNVHYQTDDKMHVLILVY